MSITDLLVVGIFVFISFLIGYTIGHIISNWLYDKLYRLYKKRKGNKIV